MSRAMITIRTPQDRTKARAWAEQVPVGTRIEFKASKRSVPQNDRMWSMLTDIASQIVWHGERLRTNDWKLLFLDLINRDAHHVVRALDDDGVVHLGRSSSDLSKGEMTDMIECMFKFGAEHGVVFNDPEAP
jgi:hypothetical protein